MTDLPNPRWRVLATHYGGSVHWWDIDSEGEYHDFVRDDGEVIAPPSELIVIDHPRNDPEAVEIIRRAKERKQ